MNPALTVSGAIFLILELDQPFGGSLQISKEPIVIALSRIGKQGPPGRRKKIEGDVEWTPSAPTPVEASLDAGTFRRGRPFPVSSPKP